MQKIPQKTVRKAFKLKTNESIKRIWGCTLEAAVNDKGKGTLRDAYCGRHTCN